MPHQHDVKFSLLDLLLLIKCKSLEPISLITYPFLSIKKVIWMDDNFHPDHLVFDYGECFFET